MKEVRCPDCGKVLAGAEDQARGLVRLPCRRCGKMKDVRLDVQRIQQASTVVASASL